MTSTTLDKRTRKAQALTLGDPVEIEQYVTAWGRKPKIRARGGTTRRMRGRVVWVGPRFVTVELEAGYRECFGYDEVRVLRREVG